jgi:hypothetical protein
LALLQGETALLQISESNFELSPSGFSDLIFRDLISTVAEIGVHTPLALQMALAFFKG